jgi:hypothetical protein
MGWDWVWSSLEKAVPSQALVQSAGWNPPVKFPSPVITFAVTAPRLASNLSAKEMTQLLGSEA